MNHSIALQNYKLLSNLKPHEKLIVDDDNTFHVDGRWIRSIRRSISGESKNDILSPLSLTMNVVADNLWTSNTPENRKDFLEEHINVIMDIEKTLLQTYPGWIELSTQITQIIKGICEYYGLEFCYISGQVVSVEQCDYIKSQAEEPTMEENIIKLEDNMVLLQLDQTYLTLENEELKDKIGVIMEQMQSQIDRLQSEILELRKDQVDLKKEQINLKEDQDDIETYLDENLDEFNTYMKSAMDKINLNAIEDFESLSSEISTLSNKMDNQTSNIADVLEDYLDENLEEYLDENFDIEEYLDENLDIKRYLNEKFNEMKTDIETLKRKQTMDMAQLKTIQKLHSDKCKNRTNLLKDELDESMALVNDIDEDVENMYTFMHSKFPNTKTN